MFIKVLCPMVDIGGPKIRAERAPKRNKFIEEDITGDLKFLVLPLEMTDHGVKSAPVSFVSAQATRENAVILIPAPPGSLNCGGLGRHGDSS